MAKKKKRNTYRILIVNERQKMLSHMHDMVLKLKSDKKPYEALKKIAKFYPGHMGSSPD